MEDQLYKLLNISFSTEEFDEVRDIEQILDSSEENNRTISVTKD